MLTGAYPAAAGRGRLGARTANLRACSTHPAPGGEAGAHAGPGPGRRLAAAVWAGPLQPPLVPAYPAGPVPAVPSRRPVRGQAGDTPDPVPGWWLAACAAAAMVAVAAAGLGLFWAGRLVLGPLLAIPVALAGIGAPAARVPLACGAVMLTVAVVLALFAHGSLLRIVATVSVVAVTALSAAGVVLTKPWKQEVASITPVEQELASLTSVAEVAQRALLPPPPRRAGPLELEVVYLAARGRGPGRGDLYEVARRSSDPADRRRRPGQRPGCGADRGRCAGRVP